MTTTFEELDLIDPLLDALIQPVLPQSGEQRLDLIRQCLRANEERLIKRYPEYHRLADIARWVEKNRMDEVEKWNALDCIECGCCSYGCPSSIPLVQLIRFGKSEVLLEQRRRKGELEKAAKEKMEKARVDK